MRRRLAATLAVGAIGLIALAAAATAGAAPRSAVAAPAKQPASMLYVIDGTSGTLRRESGNRYTLTMRGSGPAVTYFSDQPVRKAGRMSTRTLAILWKSMFPNGQRPNAALNLFLPDSKGGDSVILDLGAPRVTGGMIVFPARVIPSGSGRINAFNGRKRSGVAKTFGAAALFIDDALPATFGQCTGTTGAVQGLTITATSVGADNGGVNAWGTCDTVTQMFNMGIAAINDAWYAALRPFGGSGVPPSSLKIPLTFTQGDFSLQFEARWDGGSLLTGTYLDADDTVGDGFSSVIATVS